MPGVDGPVGLDREVIVAAGCRLVEAVGARALTMRILAEELGVSTMAAYRHVPSKSTLLILIADAMMARVKVPPSDAGSWEARLGLVERAAFAELSKAADLWDLIPAGATYPERDRLAGAVVDILLDAGFDPLRAALAHEMFFGYVQGQLRMRGQLSARSVRPPCPAAGGDDRMAGGEGRAAEGRAANGQDRGAAGEDRVLLGAVVIGGREQVIDFEEYFDFGLRVLLNGLRLELENQGVDAPRQVDS